MTGHFSLSSALKNHPNGFVLSLYVQPGASKSEIVGLHGERLKIKIKAPPVEGKANDEVLKFFKKLFKTKVASISILRGEKSRQKDIFLETSLSAFDLNQFLIVQKNKK